MAHPILALAIAALALAACNTMWAGNPFRTKDIGVGISDMPPVPPSPINRVVYACENGAAFEAAFDAEAGSVTIAEPGVAPFTMPQQETGSGFSYADAGHELRGQDQEAMWRSGSGLPTRCTATPA